MTEKQENKRLNLQQQVKNNPAFCIMPFNHSYVTTTGNANLCCVADWGNPVEENVVGKDLNEIFRGEAYRSIRQNMLAGKKEPRCYICYNQDAQGGGSDRQSQNKRFLREYGPQWVPDVNVQYPDWSDLRPGRMCNFGCRMCWGAVSTTIDAENRAYPETREISWDKPVDVDEWIDDPTCFESIKAQVEHIRVLKLAGGEPLFMQGVIKLLSWLVESGISERLHLDITTNGSRTQGKVLKLLENFAGVDIQFSMCGIGYTNDYIRYGADWDQLDRAYRAYTHNDNIRTHLLSTAQFYNIFDLANIIEYWHQHGNKECNLIFNVVNFPEDQQFDILPKADRLRVADQLESHMHKYLPKHLWDVSRVEHIVTRLRQDFDPETIHLQRQRMAKRTQLYDRIRGQDIRKVHPRIAELCEQWLTI
jgi:sulfatase maturation enzyme AslB (radical SAM superfamily)